jgi:hypothetical protein
VKCVADTLTVGIPFFVGRALFRTREDLRTLLTVLAAAGLVYVPLIVLEVVLSIPFHVWQVSYVVYGVSTQPQWRWGAIQPAVFMDNGLGLVTFMADLVAAAPASGMSVPRDGEARASYCCSSRDEPEHRGDRLWGAHLLMAVLAAPVRDRRWAATLAVTYQRCAWRTCPERTDRRVRTRLRGREGPLARGPLRGGGWVLDGMGGRFWVGWGTYGRVPGAETFGTGESGIDGWWVVRLGIAGILGVELIYLMMAVPVFLAWRQTRRLRSPALIALLGALMAIIGMRMTDLLLNGWWNHLPVFLAGALSGVTQGLAVRRSVPRAEPEPVVAQRISA